MLLGANQMTISVIIICCNAADTIERTLKSVKTIADEIIILDSGSTDNTIALCKQYTQDVHQTDWPGYGIQKQRALNLATKEWVLSIDADEVVTPELALAISDKIKKTEQYKGFTIPRQLVFANKILKYCSEYKPILAQRKYAKFTECTVHEKIIIDGSMGKIHQPFLHYSYHDIAHWLLKMNTYTSLSANKVGNKTTNLSKFCLSSFFIFLKFYFLKKGFLHGTYGFIYSLNEAFASYIKHIKIKTEDDFKLQKLKN